MLKIRLGERAKKVREGKEAVEAGACESRLAVSQGRPQLSCEIARSRLASHNEPISIENGSPWVGAAGLVSCGLLILAFLIAMAPEADVSRDACPRLGVEFLLDGVDTSSCLSGNLGVCERAEKVLFLPTPPR